MNTLKKTNIILAGEDKPKKIFTSKGVIKITDYVQNVERFYDEQPFFYDKSRIFWLWNKSDLKYEIIDEIDLMNMIDSELDLWGQTITSGIKNNYIEAMKRIGRLHTPKDAPSKWIQFKGKAYSIESGNIYDVTPDYFFTNPIPHELGTSESTPIMDKLFSEWVGESKREVLYELMAYSCYREYPIQLIFCLYGSGRNGKSQFLNVMEHFIGKENCTSVELNNLIDNRFESFKLFKKLVCQIGETDFSVIRKSSLIKKLVDGSLVGFEKKNKDPFEDRNYAKVVIASNSVPSSDDTSDGWYRRWLIIDFPHEFEEIGFPIWKSVPEQEYSNLALKMCTRLRELLKVGRFIEQGTVEQRKDKYIAVSNPLSLFIKQTCIVGEEEYENYNKLYTAYVGFLAKRKQRKVKLSEFKSALENEGFYIDKTSKKIMGDWKNGMWVEGLRIITTNLITDESCAICAFCAQDQYSYMSQNFDALRGVQNGSTNSTNSTNSGNNSLLDSVKEELVYDIIHLPCKICGQEPSNIFYKGNYICIDCHKSTMMNEKIH